MSNDNFDTRVAPPGPLLGGAAWPIGCKVGFLDRPIDQVLPTMRSWLQNRDAQWREASVEGPLLDQLLRLAPLQMPPTRELVVETHNGWTMHADNSRHGGDSVGWVGHLSEVLSCRGVIATHIPADQYKFPATQFELLGPTGQPPLRYVRTVSAGIFDEGRWRFDTSGDLQPFEAPDAYDSKRISNRFNRDRLIEYLNAVGIGADDPDYFGSGYLIELSDVRPSWTGDLDAVRLERTRSLRSLR